MKSLLSVSCLLLAANLNAESLLGDHLSPSLHAKAIIGSTNAGQPDEFAPGGHDPDRDESVQVQGIEPSLSLRTDHVEGFVTGILFTTPDDEWESEWEEAFLKLVDLPGNLELRGGRFLNRVGLHNATHLHGWSTVDAPLANSHLLGEDGMTTIGGELNWHPASGTVLTIGFGDRPTHGSHAHGEEHEEAEEHEDDHEEHEEGFEALRLDEDMFTISGRHQWRRDDFVSLTGALAAGFGETAEGEDGVMGLASLELLWRENGLEPGGRSVRWRNELICAEADLAHHEDEHGDEEAHGEDEHEEDEHEEAGSAKGSGFSSLLVVELTEKLAPFVRYDYLESIDAFESPEWTRYSFGCTLRCDKAPGVSLRLQANLDDRGDERAESFWLQVGWSLGAGEVR